MTEGGLARGVLNRPWDRQGMSGIKAKETGKTCGLELTNMYADQTVNCQDHTKPSGMEKNSELECVPPGELSW